MVADLNNKEKRNDKTTIIRICYFTDKGEDLAKRIVDELAYRFVPYKRGTPIMEFCQEAFQEKTPLVFIGAVGIAVRTISPFVKDKLQDPPIIVIDELGIHVIPILSGHYGGANELSVEIAEAIDGIPIITTATDINNAFSVDVFAREKNLRIINREGIAKVSTKALTGKPITISVKHYPPKENVDVIVTDDVSDCGKSKLALSFIDSGMVMGIGCRRGKSYEELRAFMEEVLEENNIHIKDIMAIATIDIKESEEGIVKLSRELSLPLITFDSETLQETEGDYSSSDFVRDKTGVDNVCERAAVAALGGGRLLVKKIAKDGMTIAVALGY